MLRVVVWLVCSAWFRVGRRCDCVWCGVPVVLFVCVDVVLLFDFALLCCLLRLNVVVLLVVVVFLLCLCVDVFHLFRFVCLLLCLCVLLLCLSCVK